MYVTVTGFGRVTGCEAEIRMGMGMDMDMGMDMGSAFRMVGRSQIPPRSSLRCSDRRTNGQSVA